MTAKQTTPSAALIHVMPPMRNLTGHKYGTLTVCGLVEKSPSAKWLCVCECDKHSGPKYISVFGTNLRSGHTQGCGGKGHGNQSSAGKRLDTRTRAYSVQSVAKKTKLSESTVRSAIEAGELKATKVGSRWRIPSLAFQEWACIPGTKVVGGQRATVQAEKAAAIIGISEIRVRGLTAEGHLRYVMPSRILWLLREDCREYKARLDAAADNDERREILLSGLPVEPQTSLAYTDVPATYAGMLAAQKDMPPADDEPSLPEPEAPSPPPPAMGNRSAEMMERSAQCFKRASSAPKGSPEHHAWKTAAELWRTQAGVEAPQEKSERPARHRLALGWPHD